MLPSTLEGVCGAEEEVWKKWLWCGKGMWMRWLWGGMVRICDIGGEM